ncbi:MAG: TatD family hydrolase [Bacteroidota bacterium]
MSFLHHKYIDFHTHKYCQDNHDQLCIHNIFAHHISSFDKWELFENTFFSVGLHPWHLGTNQENENYLDQILKVASFPKVLTIGECGIDKYIDMPVDKQRSVFLKQIKISEYVSKPVVVHCVKAFDEVLHLRKEINPSQPWIIHGFYSSVQMAEQLIEHGCLVSFGRQLLRKNTKSEVALQKLPLDSFLIETDDEDIRIDDMYKEVSNVKNIPLVDLQKGMKVNFIRLFGECF